jgi:hypothetical protein
MKLLAVIQIKTNGPTKEWAEGVSLALQGFTGIFQALNSNSGWFTGGLKPEDYKNAIKFKVDEPRLKFLIVPKI